MRRVCLAARAGLVLLGAMASWAQAAPTIEELMTVVQEQSRQIAEQNRLIQELNGRVQALETKQTEAATLSQGLSSTSSDLAAVKDDVATLNKKIDKRLGLSKHIDSMKVTGDLRLRQEWRDRQRDVNNPDNDDRDRLLTRLRLGLVWTSPTEGWEVGAGLITGGSDGRSGNDAWSDTHLFETGDVRLDYAYAKHTWYCAETPLTLTLGQQRSPLLVTPLMWDADLRPAGATAQYGDPLRKTYSGVFGTVGAYQFYDGEAMGSPDVENGDVRLFAGQVGYRFTSAPWDWTVALGYQHITSNFDDIRDQNSTLRFSDADGNGRYDAPEAYTDVNRNGRWDAGEPLMDGNGNGVWDRNDGYVTNPYDAPADTASPGLWHADQDGGFDIVDLLVDGRVNVGPVALRPYGQVAYNLSAEGPKSQQTIVRGYNRATNPEDPEDHALAWLLGLDATYSKLRLGYAYLYVGADAVFGPLHDNETGATAGVTDTDVRGHKLSLTWSVTPNASLSANANIMERIEGGSGNVGGTDYDEGATYQIEALYKF
jgi:Skp family chaperone for outer membrane proteins